MNNTEQNKKFRNQNIFLIILGALVCIIYGGRDSHYFGLVEKSGQEILLEVGLGEVEPKDITLSPTQIDEIKNLIKNNPNQYNEIQKSLVSPKTGKQILNEVGLGITDPKSVKLNINQYIEIKNLISQNPSEYNTAQKMLVTEKTGKEILLEVGNGIRNPSNIKLTSKQFDEIQKLIESNPQDYNEIQKSLIDKKK